MKKYKKKKWDWKKWEKLFGSRTYFIDNLGNLIENPKITYVQPDSKS